VGLADRLIESAKTLGEQSWLSTADAAALREVRSNAASAHGFEQVAAGLGVRVHVPFLDNQVLAASMGVAVADRTTATAAKPLLAAALDGLVPARLLQRRTKGDYTAALYAGLQQAAPSLRELLADPLIAQLGIIEPESLRAELDTALSGRSFPLAALCDVLAAEQWLRALSGPRLSSWTTHPPEESREHAATS
jgi:asparagine synthase (glutamine-hydrolysing)